MTRVMMAHELWEILVKAGVLDRVQDAWDRRIVIDAKEGEAVRIYIERYLSDSLLRVDIGSDGIEFMATRIDHEHFLPGSPEAAAYMQTDYWIDIDGKRVPYPPPKDDADEVRKPTSS